MAGTLLSWSTYLASPATAARPASQDHATPLTQISKTNALAPVLAGEDAVGASSSAAAPSMPKPVAISMATGH